MMRAFVLFAMIGCSCEVFAQGGPPMATDDPGTPGDGHWEINLGAIGTHTRSAWSVDAPDVDINYGLGERIQLNLDLPWTYTNADGRWRSGIGETSIAVKWRFFDVGETIQLSTYPRWQTSLSSYSERIGVASPNKEFLLPIEAATKIGDFNIAADFGRHFIEREGDYWSAGVVAGHDCGPAECLLEVHREWRPSDAQTLVNLGLRWKLSDAITLLGAAGRELGHASDDQARAVIYLGVQISR